MNIISALAREEDEQWLNCRQMSDIVDDVDELLSARRAIEMTITPLKPAAHHCFQRRPQLSR